MALIDRLTLPRLVLCSIAFMAFCKLRTASAPSSGFLAPSTVRPNARVETTRGRCRSDRLRPSCVDDDSLLPVLLSGSVGVVAICARQLCARGTGQSGIAATVARCVRLSLNALPDTVPPAPPSTVVVPGDSDAVNSRLAMEVAEAAKQAIAERGAFALAIPGGSILKMLAAGTRDGGVLSKVDWTKCTMAYVNHKCVANDDAAATHFKAGGLFLNDWEGINTITVGGSADGPAEAERYEADLKNLSETVLPRTSEGLPVFDLTLIGVGDDGHFGSLYPGRQEIADESGRWVLPVDMKSPPSITLSAAAMMASKKIIVASAGVSEKYPKGKSAAMKVAIEGAEGPRSFPAQILRGKATWLLDDAAASELSSEYLA